MNAARGKPGAGPSPPPPPPPSTLQPWGQVPRGLGRPAAAEPAVWRRGGLFLGASRRPHCPHLRLLCAPAAPAPHTPAQKQRLQRLLLNQLWGKLKVFSSWAGQPEVGVGPIPRHPFPSASHRPLLWASQTWRLQLCRWHLRCCSIREASLRERAVPPPSPALDGTWAVSTAFAEAPGLLAAVEVDLPL